MTRREELLRNVHETTATLIAARERLTNARKMAAFGMTIDVVGARAHEARSYSE